MSLWLVFETVFYKNFLFPYNLITFCGNWTICIPFFFLVFPPNHQSSKNIKEPFLVSITDKFFLTDLILTVFCGARKKQKLMVCMNRYCCVQ